MVVVNFPPSSDKTNLSVQTLSLLSDKRKKKKKKSGEHSRQLPALFLVTLSDLSTTQPQELSENQLAV